MSFKRVIPDRHGVRRRRDGLHASAPVRRSDPTPTASADAPSIPPSTIATIVAIFDAANTPDIETGELAAKKGSTKEVRDFGAMLARDHKAVRQLGRDLAKKLGVTPTPPKDDNSAKDHAAVMKKLNSSPGAEFDKAFLQNEVALSRCGDRGRAEHAASRDPECGIRRIW